MTKKKLTNEDEQAALAYLKLQDDARKLIRDVVLDLLMDGTTDPMADIVQSEIINIIRTAIEDKIDVSSNDVNPIKLPQHKLQDAILKLAFPHRS